MTQTPGLSINQASASIWSSQYGFRVANTIEVSDLLQSAGLLPGLLDPFSSNTQQASCTTPVSCFGANGSSIIAATTSMLANLGITFPGLPPFGASTSQGIFAALDSVGVGSLRVSTSSSRFLTDYSISLDPSINGWDYDTPSSPITLFAPGVFMVRGQVPSPATLPLMVVGVLSLVVVRKKTRTSVRK